MAGPRSNTPEADVTPLSPDTMSSSRTQDALRDLVAPAQDGDRAATEELLDGVHRMALRYARARLARHSTTADAAHDVAQEVCMAVLTALPRYVDKGLPFEAFVYRIAHNKVADAQRSAIRAPYATDEVPDDVDAAPNPEERAMMSAEADRLARYLDQLSARQREIVTLRVAVGLSADETAAALDMKPGAVRVAQHRALNKLRELIQAEGGDQ